MSWRDLEKKTIAQVRPVDVDEVVLELDGGMVAQIRAVPSERMDARAELRVEVRKADRPEA